MTSYNIIIFGGKLNMATRIGDFTKELRKEKGEMMIEMAEKLRMPKSYLAQVESGVRKPPKYFEERIRAEYTLRREQLEELRECMFVTINKERVNITAFEDDIKEIILKVVMRIEKDENFAAEVNNLLRVS